MTKVCQTPSGHAAVSEAVSTLRLRYGEGGRFRFLAGALLAPRAAIALRVAGISFLNSFLKSAPRTQTRLYIQVTTRYTTIKTICICVHINKRKTPSNSHTFKIHILLLCTYAYIGKLLFAFQAEACEAGLEPCILQEWLTEVEGRCEDTLTDLLRKEVQKWSQNCVDVDALQKRLARAEETCTILGNKVALLQDQLSKLQIEKRNGFNFSEINIESITKNQVEIQRLSSNGEDEGISSSERSSSPDDLLRQNREIDNKIIDNDQETTIDDVIEELRIIVKDAEEEDRKGQENFHDTSRIISDRCTTTKLSLNQEDKITQNADNIIKSKRDKLPNVSKHSKKIPINYGNFNVKENSTNEIDQICLPSAISKTPADGGSLKIVVKGAADVEEAIVPAILYPQPPRRTPPCLSTILATGPDEFNEHPVIYHSHDDEDAEEETLGDGSDSLLSASRLKYNTNEQCDDLEGQLYLSKNGVTSRDQFHIDQHNERKEIKTLRNYDAGVKSINDLNQAPLCLEVYRQFESVAKSNERSRYKSEIEKKKLLRRSVSHDFLDGQNNSSLHSRKSASKVEGRIRKFESMNSFDNCSQQNLSRNSGRRRTCDDTNSRKIRRSESCHQVSHSSRKDNSSQGGSDSGLRYITDFDMEPSVVTRRLSSTEIISEPSNQLAKSLDRIDEGLDSLVDIVIGGSKDNNGHAQKISRKYPKEKDFRNFRLEDKQQSMSNNIFLEQARPSKKSTIIGLEIKNGTRGSGNSRPRTNDHYNGIYNSSVLRNDELYQMDRVHRNHQNELNLYGKMPNFMNDINNSPFHHEKSPNKFFINDPGIFLASGKPHDAFGLGKNRFNAGKYSGNPPPIDNIGLRRNSVSKLAAKCGKVTDILSGLY